MTPTGWASRFRNFPASFADVSRGARFRGTSTEASRSDPRLKPVRGSTAGSVPSRASAALLRLLEIVMLAFAAACLVRSVYLAFFFVARVREAIGS